MNDATTLVPTTYPELEQEMYAWLEEERLTIPPSDEVQFELELELMLG